MSFISLRKFSSTTCNYAKIIPKNLRGKSKSSQEWLTRQLSDPYVEKAKIMNFRCRSAFKLLEIDDKYQIIKPGDVVVDCGASPGSWSQIAVDRTNANGRNEKQLKGAVFSLDLLHIHPIDGATIFSRSDFTKLETQLKLKNALNGRPVNCVLSDMAPNATGVRMLDQENITNLCYAVLRFSLAISAVGANLVVKIWNNGAVPKLEEDMLKFYKKVKRVKPFSSRSDSAEHFMVARYFKGLNNG